MKTDINMPLGHIDNIKPRQATAVTVYANKNIPKTGPLVARHLSALILPTFTSAFTCCRVPPTSYMGFNPDGGIPDAELLHDQCICWFHTYSTTLLLHTCYKNILTSHNSYLDDLIMCHIG